MLSKRDKEEIRNIIQGELKEALCRTITIERGPRQQGDPEKVVKEEQWNVLDFLATYLPRIEAALRGMQEDVDHAKNGVAVQGEKIAAIGQILLSMETAAKRQASILDQVRQLNESDTPRRHDHQLERADRGWSTP